MLLSIRLTRHRNIRKFK